MSLEKLNTAAVKFSPRRALLFASPFLLMGGVALVLAGYGILTRQLQLEPGKHLLTIIVVCGGTALLIFGWFASKRPKPGEQLKLAHPEKPWMWRADWAAGRVDNSERRAIFFLWIFVIFFDFIAFILAPAIILYQARYGGHNGWLSLIFPVVGAGVLVYAIKTTRTWRKFGQSSLHLSALPTRPGGVIAGEIRVPVRLLPEPAFYLRLICVRRTTALRGKTRVTTERILWQEEKWYRPNLPQPVAGVTHLPVFFQPPAGLPETSGTVNDGLRWRLEASAKVSGPDFHGLFEVPVFQAAEGTGLATAPLPPPDSTLPYQLTLDEVRKEIHSQIQVSDKASGREFLFPAGRNPGFAGGAGILWLIWTSAIVVMLIKHAPVLFPLIFTAVDAIMSIFLLDLWLRRTCVLVTPAQIKIQNSWLGYKKEITLAAADVASLKADVGATAGHAAYFDLKIRTRSGQDVLAAKYLSHKPEADWLLRQMAEVLKPSKPAKDAEESR